MEVSTVSLMKTIRTDLDETRFAKSDKVKIALLSTLYAEAYKIDKVDTSDDKVIAIVRKFVTNAEESAKARASRGEATDKEKYEIEVLTRYLPKQLTEEQLEATIEGIIAVLPERSIKMMGAVMAKLKAGFGGEYDGKLASDLVKKTLTK